MKLPTFFVAIVIIASCTKSKDPCPLGYTGTNCEKEVYPHSILIKSITATKWPTLDNGSSWDIFDLPDIYPVIFINGTQLWTGKSYVSENDNSQYHYWPGVNFDVVAFNLPFKVALYDYDGGGTADDFMGSVVTSALYKEGQKFPKHLIFDCVGCAVSFDVELAYTFN